MNTSKQQNPIDSHFASSSNPAKDLSTPSCRAITPEPKFFENQTTEPLLSTKDLAKKLNCSVSYVKKLKQQGKIHPCVSLNRFIRYRYSVVVASLQKRGINT